jgi:hemerythrin
MIRGWTKELSVHHEGMDEQHRRLFALVETLWRNSEGDDHDCGAVVEELVNYTYTHFSYEEALLAQIGYPDFRRHKKQHEAIFVAVDNIVNRLGQAERKIFYRELATFVSEWLVQHILSEDMAYGRFILARRAEPAVPAAAPAIDRLRTLKAALDEGLITQEDFERRKSEILAEL